MSQTITDTARYSFHVTWSPRGRRVHRHVRRVSFAVVAGRYSRESAHWAPDRRR